MREFLINAGLLQSSIKSIQPFISKEEARYYLNGVFFEYKKGDDSINLVATDGHKLCVLECEIDPADDINGDISAIVPTSALKTILQMLKGIQPEFPVTIKFEDANLRMWIDCADQKAEFKCIDGNFPDYRRVIPDAKPTFTIGLAKEQAAQAMKAVAAHKSKEPMQWQMIDASSPLKLVGTKKLVIVMPCRTAFDEIDLSSSAA